MHSGQAMVARNAVVGAGDEPDGCTADSRPCGFGEAELRRVEGTHAETIVRGDEHAKLELPREKQPGVAIAR